MGAHPKAPSCILGQEGEVSLEDWLAQEPEAILGDIVHRRYKGRLPFLFKVLAAAQPLSIQVHPNRQQAAAGFAREESQGIPYNAPHRNYRDAHHKPELICALGPFWALQGFRPQIAIEERLQELQLNNIREKLESCMQGTNSEEEGLRHFFEQLMTLPPEEQAETVTAACEAARPLANTVLTYQWLLRLQEFYPGDIGVLAPLFLNVVQLRAGEAMYQGSGQVHAYLEGVGIELMANSDNVLRAGLTRKHIDLPELLQTANFRPTTPSRIQARPISSHEVVYMTPAPEFVLYRISLDGQQPHISPTHRSIEILLCTEGSGNIFNPDTGTEHALRPGVSILVPAAVRQYRIEGKATIFRAAVPLSSS